MEGKRRQKGERLIITKAGGIDEKRRGLVFKRKAKVEIEVKSFSKWEIQKQAI